MKETEMKRLFLMISILTVLFLAGCGAATMQTVNRSIAPQPAGPSSLEGAPVVQAPAPEAPVPSNDALKSAQAGGTTTGSDVTSNDTERLVVQTAELTIVVKDVKTRVTDLEQMAKTMGGYVVSVNIAQTYAPDGTQEPDAQIVLRVPANQLDGALDKVKKDAVDVQNEIHTGQDITSQYVDLQSRLTAKEAAADQLTKIMESATKTQDVLDVYQQLQQVDSDIEVLKGQIQYDQESAQLSAITVHIVAEATIKPIQVGGWKPQGTARDAIQSLIYFWQGFVDFLIKFFLLILPILITISIPLFLVFLLLYWIYRLIFKRKPKAEAPKG
jgi:Domain of unknown function (DUF4349)